MARPPLHQITRPAQMRALASPVRMRIISILEKREECSVRNIAAHLGMQPESVYYHVHKLVKLGLVAEKGRGPGAARPAPVFQLVAERIHVDWTNTQPAYRAALKKAVRTSHRLSERAMQEAIDDPACSINRPGAQARFQQESVMLGEAHRRELLERLEELDRFLAEKHDPAAEDVYVVTIAVAPLHRGR